MRRLDIVGGVYREICRFPERRSIYGSGGRAAAALSGGPIDVVLHACAPSALRDDVQSQFGGFQFELQFYEANHLAAFRYLHGLATPVPEPALGLMCPRPTYTVTAENVLRYGLVEADFVVKARRVVYDPQAPLSPVLFSENGSTADELAYVINGSEAFMLTGQRGAKEQVRFLHEQERAAVVVLKQGPRGALVSDGTSTWSVPCFKTDNVYPIGSGDVFSAVFAQSWAVEQLTPESAAMRASLATAYYCETESLPIPEAALRMQRKALRPVDRTRPPMVYLAGPFFTLAQRWLIDDLLETLRGLNVRVFSPVHEVGEGPAEVVAPADLKGLDESDVVLAVLDGLDAGTVFEVGYAIAKGKPVVAFTQVEKQDDLTMLKGTGCIVESDLVTAVYKAVWTGLEALEPS